MKVYTTTEGRVIAEAESVKDVRVILKLDTSNIEKARAVLASIPKRKGKKGARYTKTHTCGIKYKYLKQHLKSCPQVIGTPVPVTRVP